MLLIFILSSFHHRLKDIGLTICFKWVMKWLRKFYEFLWNTDILQVEEQKVSFKMACNTSKLHMKVHILKYIFKCNIVIIILKIIQYQTKYFNSWSSEVQTEVKKVNHEECIATFIFIMFIMCTLHMIMVLIRVLKKTQLILIKNY